MDREDLPSTGEIIRYMEVTQQPTTAVETGLPMDEPPRPWWKSKRWIASALLATVAGYVASSGPARYFVGRWPVQTRSVYYALYAPLSFPVRKNSPPVVRLYGRYRSWWYHLGIEHSGRPDGIANGIPFWTSDRKHRVDPVTGRELKPGESPTPILPPGSN